MSVNSFIVFLSNASRGEGRAMFAAIRHRHPQHATEAAPPRCGLGHSRTPTPKRQRSGIKTIAVFVFPIFSANPSETPC